MLPIWYDHFILFYSPVLLISDCGLADTPRFHAPDLGNAAAYIRILALKGMLAARLARCIVDGYDQTLTRHVGKPSFEVTTTVHKNTTMQLRYIGTA
ncbi:MAG: hypothetical protein U9N43_03595 [Euryarchaeota archaeon]|nr:hypothetical protein [Euryarchaeota archaeon]